jgi:cytochrome c556
MSIIGAGLIVAIAGTAYAQLNPKDAVGARVNAYRETGAAFKTINDQLKSGTPVKIMMRTSARTISNTARDQYNWFPAGSGAETGLKTKAKPAIWSDAAGFKAAQDRFAQEADLMSKVVETGDAAAMQKQAKALGQACAACHQKYRQQED